MSLHSEYRELGIKRNRGVSSLAYQKGDGDPDSLPGADAVEPATRAGPDRYVAYLMADGSGVYEILKGRIKEGTGIKRAAICRSERAAITLIAEWQDVYAGA